MIDDFRNAIHFSVSGTSAAVLRLAGADTVVTWNEWLAWGPCSVNIETQTAKRGAFWRNLPVGDDGSERSQPNLKFSRRYASSPIVIWSAENWSDRLAALWMLHVVRTKNFHTGREVFLADVREESNSDISPLALCNRVALYRAFSRKTTISNSMVHRGSATWRLFAHQSPLKFDRARRSGICWMTKRVARTYDIYFPVMRAGKLCPSLIDEALIQFFRHHGSRKWHKLGEIGLWIRRHFDQLCCGLNSMNWISYRLQAWRDSRNARLIAIEGGAPRDNGPIRVRLLDDAIDIGRAGSKAFLQLPPLYVGGSRLPYDDRGWARTKANGSWSVERIAV